MFVKQHNVRNQVIELLTTDRHIEARHLREIGSTKVAWVVRLTEENFVRQAIGCLIRRWSVRS